MMLRTIAATVLSGLLTAQAPSPAGETAVLPTAEESAAFAQAAQIAAAWRSGRDDWRNFATMFLRSPGVAGYQLGRVDFVGDEAVQRTWDHSDPARFFRGGTCLLCLVPRDDGDATVRKLFAVRGDGVMAWADGRAAALGEGEPYDFLGVLGAGGKPDVHAFPLTPTRGRDGNLWQPASMLPTKHLKLTVSDEHGKPMPMCEVACVPAEAEHVIPSPLPAGRARATFEGRATIVGLPAHGMGIVVRSPWQMWIDPKNVEVDGMRVRVTVSLEQIQRVRMRANESAAIAILKNICSAQAQCQASGVIDVDGDGRGEYGTFAEMAGRVATRGGGKRIQPPVLSAAFGRVDEGGIATRSGYHFRIFLPGKDGQGRPEGKGRRKQVDPDKAEVLWCCYAWPVEAGKSGTRSFFINQAGDVLSAGNGYSGTRRAPKVTAGYVSDKGMAEQVAVQGKGSDGRQWQLIR